MGLTREEGRHEKGNKEPDKGEKQTGAGQRWAKGQLRLFKVSIK